MAKYLGKGFYLGQDYYIKDDVKKHTIYIADGDRNTDGSFKKVNLRTLQSDRPLEGVKFMHEVAFEVESMEFFDKKAGGLKTVVTYSNPSVVKLT